MKALLPKPTIPYHRNQKIPVYFRRMFGSYRGIFPRVPSIKILLWSFIASFIGISVVAALSYNVELFVSHNLPTIIGSFGASAVLVYGAIDSPLAQPRNFIGGHVLSAFIGVSVGKICMAIFNNPDNFLWLQAALSVSIAIVVMQITRTVHPPGGATALIAVTSGPKIYNLGYLYMAIPILFGTVLMLSVALMVNNISRQYPLYWRYPRKPDIIAENHSDPRNRNDVYSESRGEMYEPNMHGKSDSKVTVIPDADALEANDSPEKPDIARVPYSQNNSTAITIVDKETEIDHAIQYKVLAEAYRKKYEETEARLIISEKELKTLRESQSA